MKTSTSARSPLSPTLWPPSAFVWWGSLLLAFATVGLVFVALFVFSLVWVLAFGAASLKHPSTMLALGSQAVGVYLPVVVALGVGLPRLAQRSLRDLGLRLPTVGEIGWALAAAVGMFVAIQVTGALEERLVHSKITETAVDMLKSAHGPALALFVTFAVVIAPFVEELVFRGFIFNAFLRYTGPAVAIVLSGLLFGVAHGDPHSLPAMLPLAAGGMVLAWFYYRTGSLAVTMIAHGTFNLVSVVGLLVFNLT
ncbi:MAG TPA: type II CAAX endopeptidase family protein [Candidatus Elarobacter sp.]